MMGDWGIIVDNALYVCYGGDEVEAETYLLGLVGALATDSATLDYQHHTVF